MGSFVSHCEKNEYPTVFEDEDLEVEKNLKPKTIIKVITYPDTPILFKNR